MSSSSEGAIAPEVAHGFVVTLVTAGRSQSGRDLAHQAAGAATGGVDVIQVREKGLSGRALAAVVRRVVEGVAHTPARVLVNGRPDVAVAARAHGVQLPEEGLPIAAVRRAFPGLIVGASCHSLDACRAAADAGADFVLLGPVFASPGKESRALGLSTLAAAAAALAVPVHAVGGVHPGNVRQVRDAGARGAAAIRPFATDPQQGARRLREALA